GQLIGLSGYSSERKRIVGTPITDVEWNVESAAVAVPSHEVPGPDVKPLGRLPIVDQARRGVPHERRRMAGFVQHQRFLTDNLHAILVPGFELYGVPRCGIGDATYGAHGYAGGNVRFDGDGTTSGTQRREQHAVIRLQRRFGLDYR